MCPIHNPDIDKLFTQQIKDDFYEQVFKMKDKPFFESLMPDPKLNTESFSFKTKETVTLEQINEKLDRLLMLNNVISSTLYTGREVVEAFKKLHGVK